MKQKMRTRFRWTLRLARTLHEETCNVRPTGFDAPRKHGACSGLAVAGAILVLCLWMAKAKSDRELYSAYDPGAPLNVRTQSQRMEGGQQVRESVFEGIEGVPVPLLSFYPGKPYTPPFPCVIFLHGIGQNKAFLKTIAPHFVRRGYAIVCFDQYTRGERRLGPETGWIRKARSIRRRAALTVMETRRLVDVLHTDPDIAPERIYLLGASYGAVMGTVAAAQEPRIAGTVLSYGGGDLKRFGDSTIVRKELGSWSTTVAAAIAFLMAPADPVRYVGKLAARPLLIQNGKRDTVVPVAAAEALIAAAGKQAEVIWYDSDHVGLDKEHTEIVLNDILSWLDRLEKAE